MVTYVLVHGGWHGGWCWKKVTPLLQAAGQEVYTPTLTGLGERAHLLSDAVDQETHITDVVNVLVYEDLQDVVLVGHSYRSPATSSSGSSSVRSSPSHWNVEKAMRRC